MHECKSFAHNNPLKKQKDQLIMFSVLGALKFIVRHIPSGMSRITNKIKHVIVNPD